MRASPIAEAGGRRGIVLVAALLVLVALEIMAVGLLFLVAQQGVTARVHERALRVRLAAEDAALLQVAALLREPPSSVTADAVNAVEDSVDGIRTVRGLDAASADWLLARAEAADAGGMRAAVALVLHRRDPLRFAPLFADSVLAQGDEAGTSADAVGEDADSAFAALRAEGAAELIGLPARGVAGDVVLRAATVNGRCAPEADANWGAPDETHPCFEHVPLVRIEERLRIGGGSGRVVAVVTGQLVLAAGTQLEGAVLVAGRLDIEEGAQLRGAVTVLPGGELRVTGTLALDTAAVAAALVACAPLRRPGAAQRFWLPGY